MSGTNHRKHELKAKHVILLYGEGMGEEMFLKHLRKHYKPRYSDTQIVIKSGTGGSPLDIVNQAAKESERRKRERCIVIMDNDRGGGRK